MSADRSRLRLMLPLTCVLITAAALGVAGVVALRADGQMRQTRLRSELQIQAQTASTLVYFEAGKLVLDDLRADDVAKGSPQIVVLQGRPPSRRVFATAEPPVTVAADRLAAVAGEAATSEEWAWRDESDSAGHRVEMVAQPFYEESGEVGGAVVVVGDPGPATAEHRRLVAGLGVGGLGALLVVAAASFLLVSVRLRLLALPEAAAGQQDVDGRGAAVPGPHEVTPRPGQ
jgi:two-component system, OmpR family, sensor kinase